MSMPDSDEIEERAKRMFAHESLKAGYESITPEPEELSEGGYLSDARSELMSEGSKAEQQRQIEKYMREMGSEHGFKVLTKSEARESRKRELMLLQSVRIAKWKVRGWKQHRQRTAPKTKPPKLVIPKIVVPVPKLSMRVQRKPKPKHKNRVSIKPRWIRKPSARGKNVFSFPDDVWKVRKKW